LVVFETNFPLTLPFVGGQYTFSANYSSKHTGTAAWALRDGTEWVAYRQPSYRTYQQVATPGNQYDPISAAQYFRLLALQAPLTLGYDVKGTAVGAGQSTLGALGQYANLAFRAVEPYMGKATYLPRGGGVLWRPATETAASSGVRLRSQVKLVLWAFSDNTQTVSMKGRRNGSSQVWSLRDAVNSTLRYVM
jgi:hypothetical protein